MRKILLTVPVLLVLVFFLFPRILFADSIAPSPATTFSATLTNNNLTVSFKESADNDLDGYFVLRKPGIGYTTPNVQNGTNYSVGKTFTVDTPWEKWEVLSNDSKRGNVLAFGNGSYTYLIYMRDNSQNYSVPSRIVVNNSSPWTVQDLSTDLLVLTGGVLNLKQGYKLNLLNNGSIAWFAGSIHNDGIIEITSPVTVPATGSFKNGNGSITVKDGGALNVAGSFDNLYSAANLSINSGGLVKVLPAGSFRVEQGVAQVQAGGTMQIEGIMDLLTDDNVRFSNEGSMVFTSGGRLNLRKNITIPTATWQDGSILAYYGDYYWQGSAPAGTNQDFSNFIWHMAAQANNINLPCDLKVRHTLRVENTNGNKLLVNSCNNYNIGSIEVTDGAMVELPAGYIGKSSESNASLPVELVSFSVTADAKGAARLTWHTATEKNNEKFGIERSEDGRNWRSIGEVKGAGTVSAMRSYAYTDAAFKTLYTSEVYYRLRQIDFDGEFALSKAVSLQQAAPGSGISQVYYNAAASVIEVDYQNTGAGAMQFVLADANGRIIINQSYTLDGAAGRLAIPVKQLANGLYVAKAAAGQAYFSGKFMR